jgi:hypothetical protein
MKLFWQPSVLESFLLLNTQFFTVYTAGITAVDVVTSEIIQIIYDYAYLHSRYSPLIKSHGYLCRQDRKLRSFHVQCVPPEVTRDRISDCAREKFSPPHEVLSSCRGVGDYNLTDISETKQITFDMEIENCKELSVSWRHYLLS